MSFGIVILVVLTTVSARSAQYKDEYLSYRGHTVVRVSAGNSSDFSAVHALKRRHANLIDFWTRPTDGSTSADIRVPPSIFHDVVTDLDESQTEYQILIHDIQRLIEKETLTRGRSQPEDGFDTSRYHTYDEVITWLDDVAAKCTSECSIITIGRTYEGRPLKVIKIGTSSAAGVGIWIDAGIHAREWIAPATAIVIIEKLLRGYHSDPTIRQILNKTTWYILPMANPDGYHYSWTKDRLWRKNRARFTDSKCIGVDANRNWNYHWGEYGSSADKCSDTFKGNSAFSEAESFSMSSFIYSIRKSLKLYISLHSHGQYWLTPWGHTRELPRDYKDMLHAASIGNDALRGTFGTLYRIGSASQLLYLASGSSDDWAKAVAKIKYSYTIELRDSGKYGFLLPAKYIMPTATETFNGIKEIVTKILL